MKTGYLRCDDDGHWFLVPKEQLAEFDKQLRLVYADYEPADVVSDFNDRFGEYRVHGSIYEIEISFTGETK